MYMTIRQHIDQLLDGRGFAHALRHWLGSGLRRTLDLVGASFGLLLLSVRPGINSPASIAYRDEEAMLAASNVEEEYLNKILADKLQLDTRYVRRRSILGDLDAIFWTVVVLIPMLRRRHIPTEHLLWGPVVSLRTAYSGASSFLWLALIEPVAV